MNFFYAVVVFVEKIIYKQIFTGSGRKTLAREEEYSRNRQYLKKKNTCTVQYIIAKFEKTGGVG